MRVIITAFVGGLGLFASICPVLAAMPYTFGGGKTPHQYTHLINTNQSQIVEPMSASLQNFPRVASVTFITDGKNLEFEFSDETITNCSNAGYSKEVSECTKAGKNPGKICPYNPEYADLCCDKDFKYNADECPYPLTLGTSCGGKYKCYCDRSLYPQGADKKCTSPQEFDTSDSCTEDGKTYYAKCKCPSGYTEICSGKNQEGKGTACSQNGDTKYTGCQCKAGYTLTCSDYGPSNPSDYCELNGNKYYKTCKDCSAFKYDENNCALALSGETCGGKYEACKAPILYADKTVSTEKLSGKTPIGIVFDVKNKLAVPFDTFAISNSGQTGCYMGQESGSVFNSYQIKIPSLEKCAKSEVSTCGINGKKNTAAILSQAAIFNDTAENKRECTPFLSGTAPIQKLDSISFPGVERCFSYVPQGCSESWCGMGQWFLPSAGQLVKYINNITAVNTAAKLVNKTIANTASFFVAYSSTNGNNTSSPYVNPYWAVSKDKSMREDGVGTNGSCSNCLFIPMIDYGDSSSYIEECRALGASQTACTESQYFLSQMSIANGKTCYKCQDIKAGDYLFSDRSTSYQLEEGKTAIGIVADPEKHTAVALELLEKMPWSSENVDTPVPNGYNTTAYADGQVYTQALVDFAASRGKTYPAASKAYEYEPEACKGKWCGKGSWYLGSYYEYTPLQIGGFYSADHSDARCPGGTATSKWYCGDIPYTLYKYDGTNLYSDSDLWTSNEGYASQAVYFLIGGSSSSYGRSKSSNYKVWPMINYGSGGSCGGDLTYDKDLSLDNTGYSCLSCKNPAGETKYICDCTETSLKAALTKLGLKFGSPVDKCPTNGTCSAQMCDNKYYLQGCKNKSGTISTGYNTGDRVYCSTTRTCNLIDYRADAQNKVDQSVDVGGDVDGDKIENDTITVVNACDTCALVGYYPKQPSGYLCQQETVSGKTCYKRCCPSGYTYNETTHECFKCADGTIYDETDGLCHYCSSADYYYNLEFHMCLQIANNCPANSKFCQLAADGRGCYSLTGYTKVSASNGACVGTYDADGPSGEGCYTCLNSDTEIGTYDTKCHNCLVKKVFEP